MELAYGKALPAKQRSGGPIPVFGSGGVVGWHSEALVRESTVIVGRKGAAGAIHLSVSPCWPIDTTFFVRPRPGVELLPAFAAFQLERMNLGRLAIVTGVPGLNREDAYREPFALPPLHEQRRIVAILDRAARIRRLRRQAQDLARKIIPALFIKMFGDPATNPMGWPVVPLGSLIAAGPQNGLYRPSSEYGRGTRILRIDSIYDGEMTGAESLKRVELDRATVAKYLLRPNDIVVNRVNSRPFLGKSAIIPETDEPVVFESNLMRLSVEESLALPRYVIAYLQMPIARSLLTANAKDAINQSSINQRDVVELAVPVPSVALQRRFGGLSADVLRVSAALEAAAERARALAASIQTSLLG